MDRPSLKRPRTGGEDAHSLREVLLRPSSGFYGVKASFSRNAKGKRWQAIFNYDSKQHYLGTYDTKQEAALAYDRAARQYGQDKLLNYESITAAEEEAVRAQAEYTLAHPKQPKPRPSSGFYGVSANGKRWNANIRYDSKIHGLGCFDTKQEAALAYDRKAKQCGEDKPLNYESIKAAEEAAVRAQAEYTLAHPKQPKPRPSSGFYGVYASEKRWRATIYYDSKSHGLGCFDTKQEAALAYDRKAGQCGEDKPLNYESITAAEEAAAEAQAQAAFAKSLCTGPKQLKSRPKSGFYGVSANKKRWHAKIGYNCKNHYLGTFATKQEAALAYDREARQCAEDRPLNYESIKAAEEAAAAGD
jgi:hypothetical protein